MASRDGKFPFPFQPYPIQESFMEALYAALDQGKIGIFESPTGTGKSLSLICGALTWLRDFEEKKKQEAERLLQGTELKSDATVKPDIDNRSRRPAEPDWVSDFVQKKAERDIVNKLKVDEEDEAVKLLRLSKDGVEPESHSPEEEGLIVAEVR
ncbi:hypothetical protein DNTS_034061 [Danionella cerebrum]|uniref:Helicase ATP-binding domain-containing protein n=1 Tax=Danionella cerebrum TaxID=2873325 RepID=A0A553NMI5_9TELE|nr:hypothetical protein DNTS_034061 [Danionella translucida]